VGLTYNERMIVVREMTGAGPLGVLFEWFEWDDDNIMHATRHGVSVVEIGEAIANADRFTRSGTDAGDRVLFRSRTDAGRPVVVGAQVLPRRGFDRFAALRMIADE
jgi:hypothetical protein